MAASGYDMAKTILRMPVRVYAVTFEDKAPLRSQYTEEFNSLEDAYAFFRKEKPEGRWMVWLRGADGHGVGLDSRLWERGLGKPLK
jgi:hypothetical protein